MTPPPQSLLFAIHGPRAAPSSTKDFLSASSFFMRGQLTGIDSRPAQLTSVSWISPRFLRTNKGRGFFFFPSDFPPALLYSGSHTFLPPPSLQIHLPLWPLGSRLIISPSWMAIQWRSPSPRQCNRDCDCNVRLQE